MESHSVEAQISASFLPVIVQLREACYEEACEIVWDEINAESLVPTMIAQDLAEFTRAVEQLEQESGGIPAEARKNLFRLNKLIDDVEELFKKFSACYTHQAGAKDIAQYEELD